MTCATIAACPVNALADAHLLLLDHRVEQPEAFLALASEDLRIRVLASEEDALQVLIEEASRQHTRCVHLVAHGSPGCLQIGHEWWEIGFARLEASRLAQLGAALGPDASLLLYGCEVGGGSVGSAFVKALQSALGVPVAAASGPVGAAKLGAGWTLDVGVTAHASLALPEWPGRLGVVVLADPPARGWIGSSESLQYFAAAAIRADGSVVSWGRSTPTNFGGSTADVASALDGTIDVVEVVGSYWAYAALRVDGSVVCWGQSMDGWFTTPASSSSAWSLLDGRIAVKSIYATPLGFAALRVDGSVVQWSSRSGSLILDGSSPSQKAVKLFPGAGMFLALRADGTAGPATNVVSVTATQGAFAAIRTDGSVACWGTTAYPAYYGGDSSAVASKLDGSIDVISINATKTAFAALRADGSVVTWGNAADGGDSSSVASLINGVGVKVVSLYAAGSSFAALRSDGSLVTWGGAPATNGAPIQSLNGSIKVVSVTPGPTAFAALRADGSVVMSDDTVYPDTFRREGLNGTIDVVQVVANNYAYAALRGDGSVIAWGNSDLGGSNNAFSERDGTNDVVALAAGERSFYALREDGSVIAWGDAGTGGSTSAVSASLTDVVALANPWTRERVSYGTDEKLFGESGDDTLWGFGGNDTLDGGAGADLMLGGAGNDTYVVAQVTDQVRESTSPFSTKDAGGTDLVRASVSHTLGSFVEKLLLTGSRAINGTGNSLANTITGNGAANVLNGGRGIDGLTGAGGADAFLFNTPLVGVDTITDFRPEDTIQLKNTIFTALPSKGTLAAGRFRASSDGKAVDADDQVLYKTSSGGLFYDRDGSGPGAAVQFATLTGKPALTAADIVVI